MRKFGAKFYLFSKVEVNGPKAHPVYKYLRANSDISSITWNFGKFLVNSEGQVVKYYTPQTEPLSIANEI